jgi:hypothetical protein
MEFWVGGSVKENPLSLEFRAVGSEVPRGIFPAIATVVVGAVDMMMTEFMTFAANEIFSHVDNRAVAPVAKLRGASSLSKLCTSYLVHSLQG